MVELGSAKNGIVPLEPRPLGALAGLAGLGSLLVYPLALAGVIPGSEYIQPGVPESSHPLIVYLSVVGGAVLLIWGTFAFRRRTFVPLTPRRALLALVPAIVGIAAGVGLFTFEWAGTRPIDLEGNVGPTLDLVEIVHLELTAVQFVALAAVSMLFVGTVAASYGWWDAISSISLPIAFLALGFLWGPQVPTPLGLLLVALLATVPFAIGFRATLPEREDSSSPNR